jgi:membrane-bound lytic murein transglycosylase D
MISKYDGKAFGFASENFYCEFLAALHAEKYNLEIFGPTDKFTPLASEVIDLRYSLSLQQIMNIVGLNIDEIKAYNPDLKGTGVNAKSHLPKEYHLHLPVGLKSRFELFYKQAEEAKSNIHRLKKLNLSNS